MFVTPCRVGDLIRMGNLMLGTVQRVGGVCSMLCVFNAVQCVCTCGSSTHCVCVSVCLCVSVTAVAGATGPFKSSVRSFPPNLPYRCQLIQQLLHDGAYLKQLWETAIQWLQYEIEKVCCMVVVLPR